MTTERDERQIRQYLLGALPDEECIALEEEYFAREEALDRVWAVEHQLIEDYLASRLSATEHEQFDRHYLATPVHQHRVAIARQLSAVAGASARDAEGQLPGEIALRPSRIAIFAWLFQQPAWTMAAAAVVLLIASGAVWLMRVGPGRNSAEPATQTALPQRPGPDAPAPTSPSRPAVLLAITLSPTGVRSAGDAPPITIPPVTDRVTIHLESESARPRFSQGRATVQTVTGREVWRGSAIADSPERPLALASLDVPADRLPPDDYIVTLFERDASGRETEAFRYFLRVRAR
jgi:hypothetical protein